MSFGDVSDVISQSSAAGQAITRTTLGKWKTVRVTLFSFFFIHILFVFLLRAYLDKTRGVTIFD